MEKLVQEIDTMREEFKQQERKQAHDKWQARVEELQQIAASPPGHLQLTLQHADHGTHAAIPSGA